MSTNSTSAPKDHMVVMSPAGPRKVSIEKYVNCLNDWERRGFKENHVKEHFSALFAEFQKAGEIMYNGFLIKRSTRIEGWFVAYPVYSDGPSQEGTVAAPYFAELMGDLNDTQHAFEAFVLSC